MYCQFVHMTKRVLFGYSSKRRKQKMKNRKKWQVISAQPALVISCHPRLVHYLARYTKQAKTITSKRVLQTPALCLYPCNPLYGSGLNSPWPSLAGDIPHCLSPYIKYHETIMPHMLRRRSGRGKPPSSPPRGGAGRLPQRPPISIG